MSGDPVTVKAECYYVRSAASSLKKSGEILLEECHILKHNVSVVQNCFDGANYERLKVNVTIAEKSTTSFSNIFTIRATRGKLWQTIT